MQQIERMRSKDIQKIYKIEIHNEFLIIFFRLLNVAFSITRLQIS